MVRITEQCRPDRDTIGGSSADRDYRMSRHVKAECRRLVDETPYHPGAGGPIDMPTSACDPDPPAKIAEAVGAAFAWFRHHVVFLEAVLQPGKQPLERLSAICAKKVDGENLVLSGPRLAS